ncbi:MAG: lysophospholipid acyltransferase family protein [Kangiellaceae bacterium]|jgi:KDO2-lipid IV(A) lauroyltransferase|nr:lysophospholipid acyltransferase family protein [Kangiellaceae bacterium]
MAEKLKPLQLLRYYLVKLIMLLISLMPLSLVRTIGKWLGGINSKLQSRSNQSAKINLNLCFPDKSCQEISLLYRKFCESRATTILECFWAWRVSHSRLQKAITKVHNEDLVRKKMAEGRGIIFIGPHLGNWEVATSWLGLNYQSYGMYKEPKMADMGMLLREVRSNKKLQLIEDKPQGVRAMLSALKNNQTLIMLSDQKPGKNSGVFAPFFNQQAYTMTILQRLMEKTDAVLIGFYAKRVDSGFEIVLSEPRGLTKDLSQEDFAAQLNNFLASQIMECPEQFEWVYRRFKPQPGRKFCFYKCSEQQEKIKSVK